ncbi:tudor and KH domain-containing protein homolog isoform X2 [Linepithema humile]|uniref:tudor and KH domain-containing protein homolog isoform X2 n=1 Tax=Linepithema humile TaxID=83485 RepID=UPI000623B889|nr:PREDICTED: tudor and KH domain-containing protein isoform X2 [Linepithema humile]
MKWMSSLNNNLIPILIGISLTTLSLSIAVLLYPALGKDDDAENDNTKKFSKIIRSERKEIRLKVPKQFVSAVIGRGGSVINNIRTMTGTRISMDDDIDCLNCTCTIQGNDMESILLAESLIKNIIDNQPIIETYELFVPHEACWRILKKNVVQVIIRTTGVKIMIDHSYVSKNEEKKEKRIILKGTAEQIASAVTEIEDLIREVNKVQAQIKCEVAATAKRMSKSALSPRNNNVNNVASINGSEPLEIPLPQDGLIEVYVSAMESPSKFWIHVVGPGNIALQNLVSEMTEYYDKEENRELHTLKKIAQGQMVAAKFGHDGKWYRAEVTAVITPTCEVWFVDYGDKDIVPTKDILELRTDMLSLRPQAVECSLANVKPRENEWDFEAIDKFAELVSLAQWKVLVAKVSSYKERSGSRREGSPIPCFDLYDKNDEKNINIGETMVRLELAQFEEICRFALVSTLLPDKCDFPSASSTPLTERVSKAKPVSPLQPAEAIDTAEEKQIEQSTGEMCVETPKEKDEINDSLTTS